MRGGAARPLRHLTVAGADVERGLHLPQEPHSAGVARGHVRQLLPGWSADRVQDALLLTTELVSNAIIHGWPDIELRADRDASQRLRVEVFDAAPTLPRMRASWAGGGRGLTIVDEMADGWGVIPAAAGGKTVWFELLG